MDIAALEDKARVIRRHIIEMISTAQSGHPGGSLSATDIITALYFYKMRYDVRNPSWESRDRFVLSKGHAAPALYAALAEAGFIPVKYLLTLRQIGSSLQGHPDMLSLPGLDMTTGSLGQGLSVANGMALAAKLDNLDYNVYVMLGDGESQEGQVWEAAMTAGHRKLGNVIAILDRNKLQIDGMVEDIKGIEPVADKWRAFRWNVLEIDGHDMKAICEALDKADSMKDKPAIIIANTIKGKGISFMEGVAGFHGKAPDKGETEKARGELCQ
ncbi:MAG: transketolase [bacterium]